MMQGFDFYCSSCRVWIEPSFVLPHLCSVAETNAAACEIELAVRYPQLADPEE